MKKKLKIVMLSLLSCLFLLSCGGNISKSVKNEDVKQIDSTSIKLDLANKEFTKDSLELSKVKSFSVNKISGNHKYGGRTKIEYKSYIQLIEDSKHDAKTEMTSDNQLNEDLLMYKESCFGGQVTLYVDRSTIGHANTDNYEVIIKDLNEKELYRERLEESIPEVPGSDGYWWNIKSIWISKKTPTSFYVYVVDKLTSDVFKFQIKSKI